MSRLVRCQFIEECDALKCTHRFVHEHNLRCDEDCMDRKDPCQPYKESIAVKDAEFMVHHANNVLEYLISNTTCVEQAENILKAAHYILDKGRDKYYNIGGSNEKV